MKISSAVQRLTKEKDLKQASKHHYNYVADLFMREMNITDIEDVNREILLEWRCRVQKRKVSSETWNNYLRHILVVLRHCKTYMELAEINTHGLSLKSRPTRPKTVTIVQIKKVIQYLMSDQTTFQPKWFWACVLKTIFFTGMRRKQLAGLVWKHICFNTNTIEFCFEHSKNGNDWVIPIPRPVIDELKSLRDKSLEVIGRDVDISELPVFNIALFNTRYTSGLTPDNISGFFRRLSQKTSIPLSAHRLRHTVATHLSRVGMYKELQNLLGHSTMQMTMRYIHPDVDNIREMVDTLDDLDI